MTSREKKELLAYANRIYIMGEIKARARFENSVDVFLSEKGKLPRKKIKGAEIEAVVDTGAFLTLIPQELAEKLGVRSLGKAVVTLANEQRIELEQVGPVRITICERSMNTDCLVGPPGCEPLLGQIVLEGLDLIPDPRQRTLTVRPEFPYLRHHKLKAVA